LQKHFQIGLILNGIHGVDIILRKKDILILININNVKNMSEPKFWQARVKIKLCYLEVLNHNQRGRRSTKKVRSNMNVWEDMTLGEFYQRKGPPRVNLT